MSVTVSHLNFVTSVTIIQNMALQPEKSQAMMAFEDVIDLCTQRQCLFLNFKVHLSRVLPVLTTEFVSDCLNAQSHYHTIPLSNAERQRLYRV